MSDKSNGNNKNNNELNVYVYVNKNLLSDGVKSIRLYEWQQK